VFSLTCRTYDEARTTVSGRGLSREEGSMRASVLSPFSLVFLFCSVGCQDAESLPLEEVGSSTEELGTGNAVGLALDVDNGIGTPVSVKRGQKFYVNQLDLRASVSAATDDGITQLTQHGDFASLDWDHVAYRDIDYTLLPAPDGFFSRRRYFDGADWMERPSLFFIVPTDAHDRPTGLPIILSTGSNRTRSILDGFFVRRLRAIQWTDDCVAPNDAGCTGGDRFSAEGLVELRWATPRQQTFTLSPSTTGLRVFWTEKPGSYVIPVTQVAQPNYAYGFGIDVTALTPPQPNGTYAPGTDITFRVKLTDAEGKRLHPVGSLPTYNEVKFGVNEPGIQYYGAFFDPVIVYWRHKHRERMLMAHIAGPAQDIQPIRSIITLDDLLGPEDTQTVGDPDVDGVYAAYQTFPASNDLFTGNWDAPVPDTVTFHLSPNAKPGTYLVTVKGKRVYLGEEFPTSKTIEIQVGTTQHTQAALDTGKCQNCHKPEGALSRVLHGIGNRATCTGCHAPLPFEHNAPVYVRVHFIHSRIDGRYDDDLAACQSCHLDSAGIQRTSKSACMSCHTTYPADHVASFGPIENSYVGGGAESLDQCTSSCHTSHPGAQL
jgi:Cytochrome c7 and related cytochrome c